LRLTITLFIVDHPFRELRREKDLIDRRSSIAFGRLSNYSNVRFFDTIGVGQMWCPFFFFIPHERGTARRLAILA